MSSPKYSCYTNKINFHSQINLTPITWSPIMHKDLNIRIFRPQFISKNKGHAISWDLMLISSWNFHKLVSLKKGLIMLQIIRTNYATLICLLLHRQTKQIFSGNVIWLQFINQLLQSPENERGYCCDSIIFHGMAVDLCIKTGQDFADVFWKIILEESQGFTEVRVSFDRYDELTLKSKTREDRTSRYKFSKR